MPIAPRNYRPNAIEQLRGTRTQRGYCNRWLRLAEAYRAEHPVCEQCRDAVATDTDHVIPFCGLGDPLRLSWSNLRALCRPCHQRKTHGR
jgi:5-methylcytosine-specific restriction enzyme A